jgi:hypothetical protein
MSYANAMRYLQKNLFNFVKGRGVRHEVIAAMLQARQFNQFITEQDLGNGPGKARQLKINYYAPICDTSGTCGADLCSGGTAVPPSQAFFQMQECTASPVFLINKDDLRYIDGDYSFSDNAQSIIFAYLATAQKNLATAILAKLVANVGLQPNGNATTLLPWVDKNTGAMNPIGLWEVERAYRDTGYGTSPFIVGGQDVFYWQKATEIAGLNAQGQNLARLDRTNAYHETLVDAAFADPTYNHIISFDPQVLKFVTFSENAGMFATDLDKITDMDTMYARGGTDYIEGTLVDPVYGLIWDLNAVYDKCDKVFRFQFQLKWDIYFMPEAVCNIQGVNGIFHFTTCAPTITECPTGSPVTPASTSTFDLETSTIFGSPAVPVYVGSLTVGNITTQPNATVANATEFTAMLNAEIPGYTFSLVGTEIRYTGYSAVTGNINGGDASGGYDLVWS